MSFYAGIDIGSVTTKCVILRDDAVAGQALVKTGTAPEAALETVLVEALKQAAVQRAGLASVITTGYGRRLFPKADRIITEISAAALGAWIRIGRQACLVVDVGGQDTKIIEVSAGGEVTDFLMNDKCAAGTGRFLEMMAGVLETDLEGLSRLALASPSAVTINSTCSVFAESEVVSLISHTVAKGDIAAGLLRAIAERIAAMLRHFGQPERVVFCGGGARSPALKQAIERLTGRNLLIPDQPQFVVAYGAALSGAGKAIAKGAGV